MEITSRKKKIFKNLVKEHIKTGMPVGSNFLVSKTGLEVSSATIRNELAQLEEYGLLNQPHTSAGRVPSTSGFQFYVDNLMEVHPLNNNAVKALKSIKKNYKLKNKELYKTLAKEIASISNETVIVAFGANDIYYTGFSNLFTKPEMADYSFNFGNLIDKMNDIMHSAYHKISDEKLHILLGEQNPFGSSCASILAKVDNNLIVVLGLLRMDYDENASILNFIKDLLNE
ncbi:MAG: hypothetical protein WC459_04190 [Patescibacteria group bacterium]